MLRLDALPEPGLLWLAASFFLAMLAHDFVTEAAFAAVTPPGGDPPKGFVLVLTGSQFAGCALGPFVIRFVSPFVEAVARCWRDRAVGTAAVAPAATGGGAAGGGMAGDGDSGGHTSASVSASGGKRIRGAASRSPSPAAVDGELPLTAPPPSTAASSGGKVAEPEAAATWLPFVGLACLVFTGNTLANSAVTYVEYPVKVVFKSGKLIPTMVVSSLMQGRRYRTIDYLSAVVLCLGVAGFAWGNVRPSAAGLADGGDAAATDASVRGALGASMLLAAIFADAFVPNVTERLLRLGVPQPTLTAKTNSAGLLLVLFEVRGHATS